MSGGSGGERPCRSEELLASLSFEIRDLLLCPYEAWKEAHPCTPETLQPPTKVSLCVGPSGRVTVENSREECDQPPCCDVCCSRSTSWDLQGWELFPVSLLGYLYLGTSTSKHPPGTWISLMMAVNDRIVLFLFRFSCRNYEQIFCLNRSIYINN